MVGAPSIKGGTPRENLTTLHTTPHTQLSPFRSNSSTSVQGFGEPECSSSSCCHGGSAAAPAAVSHVHRLRWGVLRVQAGRAGRDDAEGDRLRLRQGRRLHPDDAERALLQHPEAGGLLLHHQQLLPEERPHGRHLRLRWRRHPHHHRPQLRQLQVRLRTERRRHRRRNGRRHRRRNGCRHWRRYRGRDRSWHGRRNRSWHWSRHGHGRRDGNQHRSRHRRRHGSHDARKHPQPTVRRRLRPLRQRHGPGLQRCRRGGGIWPPGGRRRATGRGAPPFPPRIIERQHVHSWLARHKGRRIRRPRMSDAASALVVVAVSHAFPRLGFDRHQCGSGSLLFN